MKTLFCGLMAVGLIANTTAADAHHSFSMFDVKKTVAVNGTVTNFRWQMPHVWIHMMLPGPDGKPVEWAGECHSPNIIARKGWKSNTIKPGDKIKVMMHPMRDGSAAGSVISVELPNGTILMNAESKDRV
jgi:hypothetical protein